MDESRNNKNTPCDNPSKGVKDSNESKATEKTISRREILSMVLGFATATTGALALNLMNVKVEAKTKEAYAVGMTEQANQNQDKKRRRRRKS